MKFFWEARKVIVLSVLIYIILKPVFFFGVVSQYIEQITLYTLIVILTSLGLNVIYGYTGQFSLGHAAFYGIGAYMSAYLTKVFRHRKRVFLHTNSLYKRCLCGVGRLSDRYPHT